MSIAGSKWQLAQPGSRSPLLALRGNDPMGSVSHWLRILQLLGSCWGVWQGCAHVLERLCPGQALPRRSRAQGELCLGQAVPGRLSRAAQPGPSGCRVRLMCGDGSARPHSSPGHTESQGSQGHPTVQC